MGEENRVDTCDTVVVGAGIVGAAVASRLAGEGVQVAVLDAQGAAGGATGRSAGMVITGLPGHYQWAVETFGRERARALWALTVEGRDRLVDAAMRLGVPLQQPGSLAVAVTEEESRVLETSADLLREDGFDAWFGYADTLGRGFVGMLRQRGDAVVNAAALTQALLDSAPVMFHPNTEVLDLETEGPFVRVWAQGRTVRCKTVILTVGGYAPLLDPFFGRLISIGRARLVATAPLPAQPLPMPCYADYGYEYACPLPDNRLLLGAWRRPRRSDAAGLDSSPRDGLARFVERYFADVQGHVVEHRSGSMGLTPDGIPIIGRLPELPQAFFAVGLGVWGLNWAFVVAEALVKWLLEGDDPGIFAAARLV